MSSSIFDNLSIALVKFKEYEAMKRITSSASILGLSLSEVATYVVSNLYSLLHTFYFSTSLSFRLLGRHILSLLRLVPSLTSWSLTFVEGFMKSTLWTPSTAILVSIPGFAIWLVTFSENVVLNLLLRLRFANSIYTIDIYTKFFLFLEFL